MPCLDGLTTSQESQRRIIASRAKGLSDIERILCAAESRVLLRIIAMVSGQRCLLSFWDRYSHIRLHLFNTLLSRQLTLDLDGPTLHQLGLLKPSDYLTDVSLQTKEAICQVLPKHVEIRGGELGVRRPAPPGQGVSNQAGGEADVLACVSGKLQGVDVTVSFRGLDKDHVLVEVQHVWPPSGERVHRLPSLTLQQWYEMGFPNLDWFRTADKFHFGNDLLKRLRPCQGCPGLEIADRLEVPVDFEPLDASVGKDCLWFVLARESTETPSP